MEPRLRLQSLALVVLLSANCATMGLHETARTTAPGRFEFGGVLTPVHLSLEGAGADVMLRPLPELYGKLGVSDRLDLGLRVGFQPAASINIKYQLARGNIDAAVHMALFVSRDNFGTYEYDVAPTVIVSSEKRSGAPYVFNVGLVYTGLIDPTLYKIGIVSVRAGAGLPLRVGPRRAFRIIPEFSVLALALERSLDGRFFWPSYRQTHLRLGASIGYTGPDIR